MATAVRYNGPSTSATIRASDGQLYTCPSGSQITVPDDTAIALFAEGWTAPDGTTPGYTPPGPNVVEEVFLVNGALSKHAPGGGSSTVPVGSSTVQHNGVAVATPNFLDAAAADLVALGMDYGLRPTTDKTATFSAVVGSYVVCNTVGGAFPVNLPGNSTIPWARVGVHNRYVSGTNAVTVNAQTPDVFTIEGGAATRTLVPGQWEIYKYDPSRGVWTVEQQGISKSGLDALYAAIGAGGSSGWSQVPDGLMGIGHPAIPDNVGMAWSVALEPKGIRVKCNKTGTLTSLYVNVGTSNGNWIGGVYDTGQATSGTRTQLWKGASTASAAGWLKLGAPAIPVTAGQWYDFTANNDGTTATLKQFANSGLSSKLPNDLWPDTPGGAQARLAFKYAATATLDLPATVVDSSVTPNGKVPGIFGLVV